jgi:hypothetical protein
VSFALAAACTLPALAESVPAQILALETTSYSIRIEVYCEEGLVTCKKVRYKGSNRRTNQSVSIWGRTVPATCRDTAPCSLQGYEFNREKFGYYVTKDGALIVSKGSRTVLREKGTWNY